MTTVNKISSAPFGICMALAVVLSLPQSLHAQDAQNPNPPLTTPTTAPTVLNFQAPAGQAPTGALMDRLDRLERDIRTLNQQIARMPADAPGGVAAPAAAPAPATLSTPKIEYNEGEGMLSRLTVRLGALESEVRAATGQSESLSFRIDQLTRRFDKLLVDLDYRLARLEGTSPGSFSEPAVSAAPASMGVSKVGAMPPVGEDGAASEGLDTVPNGTVLKGGVYKPAPGEGSVLGTVSKSKVDAYDNVDPAPSGDTGTPEGGVDVAVAAPVAPATAATPAEAPADTATGGPLPEGSVQDRYRFAFDLTRQARYDEAELAFKAFLDAHGEDDLANNARYWLAET